MARWRSDGAARRRIGGPTRPCISRLPVSACRWWFSLHSVVGMDFAASLMPGWQETIFPPYFVVGAMYSGFAMVVCLAALVRWGFRMQALITLEHFDVMAKIMLAAAVIMGLSYANEWFNGWYGGEHANRSLIAFEFTGAYAPMFWALLLCNVVIPQAFWSAVVRRNVVAVFAIAVLINIGMWLERILIVWNTLSHDYAVSMWRLFLPTVWDWITTIGSLGLFALMYLIFVRLLPVVSMHEVRKSPRVPEVHGMGGYGPGLDPERRHSGVSGIRQELWQRRRQRRGLQFCADQRQPHRV